jgi:hypothetical protein
MTSSKAWVSAIWGGLTGGLGSLTVVLVGNTTLSTITEPQWLAVLVSVVVGFGGGFGLTYHTTNLPAPINDAGTGVRPTVESVPAAQAPLTLPPAGPEVQPNA